MEFVYGGFEEGDGREDRIERKGLVPELDISRDRAFLVVLLLDRKCKPAEKSRGLDITYGEAVPEHDRGFLARNF
jgi:hypothetical protein